MVVSPAQGSSFKRLIFRATVLPVILLIGLAVVLVVTIETMLGAAAWVEHTDRVISETHQVQLLYVDMETALRGFLLTGDRQFIEHFERGVERAPPMIKKIKELAGDNPAQQQRLDDVRAAGDDWLAYARHRIDRPEIGTPAATQASLTGRTKMEAVRDRLTEVVRVEETLRAERSNTARQTAHRGVFGVGGAVLVVGGVLMVLSRRETRRLADTYEAALATANTLTGELELRVEQRTDELNTTNAQLTELNRELEAFTYSISHDLRAPLRHIAGFADLLKMSLGPTLAADDKENLDTIGDTAKLAGRMVDDLLSFSRIGRAELKRESVDMNELFDRGRREMARDAAGRDVAWTLADLPPAVGDRALIKLVVTNLLSNALKYTSEKEQATIDVSARPGEDGWTVYAVRDNGVGFDMAYAHKLFGVFQRLHRAEEYEGTGIGLANVRRIITRHGGQAWAEGKPGAGATFYFSLPNRT